MFWSRVFKLLDFLDGRSIRVKQATDLKSIMIFNIFEQFQIQESCRIKSKIVVSTMYREGFEFWIDLIFLSFVAYLAIMVDISFILNLLKIGAIWPWNCKLYKCIHLTLHFVFCTDGISLTTFFAFFFGTLRILIFENV